MSGWAQAAVVLLIVALVHVPLGNHLAKVYTSPRHSRAERVVYRLVGADPEQEQTWWHYLGSLLAFSLIGVLGLYALLRMQTHLPLSLGHSAVDPGLAFNTAVSFVTNTSWQSYAGEATLGHLAQMAGLGTQAFASAAVGMCAGVALVRGLVRNETDRVGNFWVDLTRSTTRVLLPLAFVVAIVLVAVSVKSNETFMVSCFGAGSRAR